MSTTVSTRIAIQNAPAGGATHVGLKRALRLVKRKDAVWISAGSIRLVVIRHKNPEQRESERLSGRYYDAINRRMKPKEQLRIPFTRAIL